MIGTGADIDIVVTCMNDGEDSFGSQVLIKLPDGVDFNKMTKLQAVSLYLHVVFTVNFSCRYTFETQVTFEFFVLK